MPIITDLSPPQTAEGFILDPNGSNPLNLGNGGSLQLAEFTFAPPPKRPEWATNGDVDGAALVRNPYHDNREGTFKVRCMDGTMDQAIAAIKLLEDKLQEACLQGAGGGDGLPFLWTPAHASTGLTGYMLFAQITDLPVTYSDGWFAQHPILTVQFQAKPFLYGAEVTGPTATGTAPLLMVTVPNVPGDVPAEARLVITDGSAKARHWIEGGLEQFHYNASSPSSLLIDSEDLVTTGFAGVQATQTGAYRRAGATHDVVSATLVPQPTALCGTGNLPHIGTFRVKARVWAQSNNSTYWRLTWQDGNGAWTSNAWASAVYAGFNEVDLGLIDVSPAEAGTQRWQGWIEAYTVNTSDTGAVDYLALFPSKQYWRVETGYRRLASTQISTRDDFGSLGTGAALNARTAPVGGAWATSGATGDLVGTGTGTVKRATSSDTDNRYAVLGTGTLTDAEVGISIAPPAASQATLAVTARWTDSSNYLRCGFTTTDAIGTGVFFLQTVVAGVQGGISPGLWPSVLLRLTPGAFYVLRLVTYASGMAYGVLESLSGSQIEQLSIVSTDLATGGTLASGKSGFLDKQQGSSVAPRLYDSFYSAVPTAEQVAINSGQSTQITSDAIRVQSADGTAYGELSSRGSRLFIPAAGDQNRTTRIAVRATREDPATMASRNDGDSLTLSVFYKPRYLVVPR